MYTDFPGHISAADMAYPLNKHHTATSPERPFPLND